MTGSTTAEGPAPGWRNRPGINFCPNLRLWEQEQFQLLNENGQMKMTPEDFSIWRLFPTDKITGCYYTFFCRSKEMRSCSSEILFKILWRKPGSHRASHCIWIWHTNMLLIISTPKWSPPCTPAGGGKQSPERFQVTTGFGFICEHWSLKLLVEQELALCSFIVF